MAARSSSRAVLVGYRLATLALMLAIAFGALVLVSIAVGIARGGDSLLYGDRLLVSSQLSPDDVAPLPAGLEFRSWLDVTVAVPGPTVGQMLLRSGQDLGPVALFVAGLW